MDTAAHLERLAQALQRLAPGLVFWSGVGFLDQVPEALRQAVGEEWSLEAVQAYLAYQAFTKPLDTKILTVVLAAPCPPDQLAALQNLEAGGHLGCAVILERRKPSAWGGWTLPATLSPLLKRHSATGGYLEELGFHEGGWVEWESTEKCQARLLGALTEAGEQSPAYVVVACVDSDVEFEMGAGVTPHLPLPPHLARSARGGGSARRQAAPDTVFQRFSQGLAALVAKDKLLWLDESAVDAPKATEQHLRMFRTLEQGRVGKPVLVVPSALLPFLYDELRQWCRDRGEGSESCPVMVVHGSGIPTRRDAGFGGLTDGHLLLSIPELVVARPADEEEAADLFMEAVAHDGPTAIVFSGAPAVGLHAPATHTFGRGRRLREGSDVAILAIGSTVFPSLLAAESLLAVGLEVAVYDLRYRRPMDQDLLVQVVDFPLVVTVEEGPESSSFATHLLSSENGSGRLIRLTVEVAHLQEKLDEQDIHPLTLESFGMHAEGIARAIKTALGRGTINHF